MKAFLAAGLVFAEKSFDNERLMIDNGWRNQLPNESDCKIKNATVYDVPNSNRVKVVCNKGHFLFNKDQKIKRMSYTREHLDLWKKKKSKALGSLSYLKCGEAQCTKKRPVPDCSEQTVVYDRTGVKIDKSDISFPTGFGMMASTGRKASYEMVKCYETFACILMCSKDDGQSSLIALKKWNTCGVPQLPAFQYGDCISKHETEEKYLVECNTTGQQVYLPFDGAWGDNSACPLCKVDNGSCIQKEGKLKKYIVQVTCDSSYEFRRDSEHSSSVEMTYDGKFTHYSRKGYKNYSAGNICKPVNP